MTLRPPRNSPQPQPHLLVSNEPPPSTMNMMKMKRERERDTHTKTRRSNKIHVSDEKTKHKQTTHTNTHTKDRENTLHSYLHAKNHNNTFQHTDTHIHALLSSKRWNTHVRVYFRAWRHLMSSPSHIPGRNLRTPLLESLYTCQHRLAELLILGVHPCHVVYLCGTNEVLPE